MAPDFGAENDPDRRFEADALMHLKYYPLPSAFDKNFPMQLRVGLGMITEAEEKEKGDHPSSNIVGAFFFTTSYVGRHNEDVAKFADWEASLKGEILSLESIGLQEAPDENNPQPESFSFSKILEHFTESKKEDHELIIEQREERWPHILNGEATKVYSLICKCKPKQAPNQGAMMVNVSWIARSADEKKLIELKMKIQEWLKVYKDNYQKLFIGIEICKFSWKFFKNNLQIVTNDFESSGRLLGTCNFEENKGKR